jgi:twitching motility protein PilT
MLRLKGDLVPIGGAEGIINVGQMYEVLDELLDDERREDFHTRGDLDFAYAYGTRARFRSNYLYKTTGPAAVFRTIPTTILRAEQLGLSDAILGFGQLRSGLVLVTGPTGSGKSTTLAALIDNINRTRDGHILTIEDPVEFVHHPIKCMITHREIGVDAPGFNEAIASAGRENPDVVLVGELRGAETMRSALQMASYGVLVFATVHTNSASETVDRFINVFPAPEQPAIRGMLAESLAGVVSQQLLKTKDGSGRIAAHEVMVGSTGIRSAIREGKNKMLPSLIQGGGSLGMCSMDATLKRLLEEDIIGPVAAFEKANDKENFAKIPSVARAIADI